MLPPADWNPANPATDLRLSDWECVQYLVRALTDGGGNAEAAQLVRVMGGARALAYRLNTIAERKGWADEALVYNILVTFWPQIQAEAAKLAAGGPAQAELVV